MFDHEQTRALLEGCGIPLVESVFVSMEEIVARNASADALLADRASRASARLIAAAEKREGSKRRYASVVLKLLASGFSHKSDSGFVALELGDPETVRTTALGMLARLPMDSVPEGFLVQPMIRGGREVFIGAQVDAQFGPVVAFGPGGILVELLGGVDFLRPPFGREEALLFLRRNAMYPVLAGARGAKPADIAALAGVLVSLGDFMLADKGGIQSVDLNPFVVFDSGEGGLALDARIGGLS